MENRIKQLLLAMENAQLDGVLLTSSENIFYFSGFTGGTWGLLVTGDKLLLFTDSRYTIQAKQEAPLYTVYADPKAIFRTINESISEGGRLGFEEWNISVKNFSAYSKELKATLTPVGEIIRDIRKIKDEEEIRRIAEAERLGDEAFSYILPRLKVGMRETEVAAHLEYFMRQNGAYKPSFDTIVASGERSALPHGAASEKELAVGDFVTMDFGCVLDGYCSDMTRTVVMKEASENSKAIYHTVLCAQERALNLVRPGMPAKNYDKIARDVISEAGYGAHFGHSLGHGVGIEIHEAPSASPRSEDILLPGMTVTCEPGIYIEGFGGVRIEDLIVIREHGAENLTASSKKLIIL